MTRSVGFLLTKTKIMTKIAYCTYIAFGCIMWYLESKWYGAVKMSILWFLLLFDTITGIYKDYAIWTISEKEYYDNGKVKNKWFNSTILKVWVIGKILLLCVPIWFIAVAHLGWYELWKLLPIFVWLLWWAELVSIIQNIWSGITKKQIQEFDAISLVLGWILGVVKEQLIKYFTTQQYKKQ